MARVTLDVVERTIFSDGFGSDAEQVRVAMATYFNTIGQISPLDEFGVPEFIPRLSRLRVRSTLKFFEAEIDRVISGRRRLLAQQPDLAPNDLLTSLLEAFETSTGDYRSRGSIKHPDLYRGRTRDDCEDAELGDVPAVAIPEMAARIEAEVDRELTGPHTTGIADRLVETRAVIDETIRLYPPIAAISRVAIEQDELNGEPVKIGIADRYLAIRAPPAPLLWDSPGAFDPQRFLASAQASIDRFAYLPFGVGPRKCIGSTFALQEATLVPATIVKRFRFQLSPGHEASIEPFRCSPCLAADMLRRRCRLVSPVLRVTLRPANGLPMIISKRSRKRMSTAFVAEGATPRSTRSRTHRGSWS